MGTKINMLEGMKYSPGIAKVISRNTSTVFSVQYGKE
jgi:hypothetical protein